MIQLTDVFCVLLRYKWAIYDYNKQLILSSIYDPIKRRALYFDYLIFEYKNTTLFYNPNLQLIWTI